MSRDLHTALQVVAHGTSVVPVALADGGRRLALFSIVEGEGSIYSTAETLCRQVDISKNDEDVPRSTVSLKKFPIKFRREEKHRQDARTVLREMQR